VFLCIFGLVFNVVVYVACESRLLGLLGNLFNKGRCFSRECLYYFSRLPNLKGREQKRARVECAEPLF